MLLPHRLSFDRHSKFSTQAAQSEHPPHPDMADIQPSATFLPHCSLPYGSASVDTVITDGRAGNTGEALMERCSAFNNATHPISISSRELPNTLTTACGPITGLNNNVDNIPVNQDTTMPYGYLFQANPAVDVHDPDGQPAAPLRVSNPSVLPSYISSASISPSPPASTPSPPAEHEPIWREGTPESLYARRLQRLDYLHPEIQKHIASIIEVGDHFLREDSGTFLRLFCRRWSQTDLGYRPVPSIFDGDDSRMQNLLRRYYHAEGFRRRSDIDRLKFRFLRILLYHDFEELCISIQSDLERYRGQNAATVATNKFINGLGKAYGGDVPTRTECQQRQSFRKHKAIGRRWSIVASHFGLGIFLTCSPELEAYINDHNFPEQRFPALLTYIINVYPRGSQLSQEFDPFVRSIIQGDSPPLWPTSASLDILSLYRQENERGNTDFCKEWMRIEVHNFFYRIL
ncbi:hypothetical protein T440DRAFT_28046 [Plenodomus tracheiphilus IPT5]|uniref:Uncharacterized protein n=1 Tax=Plenodomus tracheiphilus IPT5 TaxID=1408161 RepID=A0A6A7AM70_9PLEO|nr:hypothetical protein T440DRAFT_28046 [Plenodomus tracheiphilus IPT5]